MAEKQIMDQSVPPKLAEIVTKAVPNQQLTAEQRKAKKELKDKLKFECRKKKYRVRYAQALERKDHQVAEKALRDLEQLIKTAEEGNGDYNGNENAASDLLLLDDKKEACSRLEQASRDSITTIHQDLQWTLNAANSPQTQNNGKLQPSPKNPHKEFQTEQARLLLRNMTKGTQDLSMFDNYAALRGYVRQKFFERAVLVVSSLCKLQPNAPSFDNYQGPSNGFHELLWKRLIRVRKMVSIGCGPGCDGVGIASLISKLQNETPIKSDENEPTPSSLCKLEEMILLDWAMTNWSKIVNPLEEILVPDWVGKVQSDACNVLTSLHNQEENENVAKLCDNADLIITSYLLSETRGKWYEFYDDIMDQCCSSSACDTRENEGTLFLFSDPTAWQLHEWVNRHKDRLEGWCWLDSSMNQPELQALEGRVGPAVLLAMTKPASSR